MNIFFMAHTIKSSPQPAKVKHATFDLNRELIASFWMTRLDQHQLILNATSGTWEIPFPLPAFLR